MLDFQFLLHASIQTIQVPQKLLFDKEIVLTKELTNKEP